MRIRYSDSKPWSEAMTKEDLDKMAADFQEARRLPGKRQLADIYPSGESADEGSGEEKKTENKKRKKLRLSDQAMLDILKPQKARPKLELKSKVVEYFQKAKLPEQEVENPMFVGMEFYIVNSDDKKEQSTKRYLEEQIIKYGGTRVQNLMPTTTHLVAVREDFRTRAIVA